MTELCNELERIQFGIYSADEIQKMSVCDVHSTKLSGPNSVYDKRMGVLEMNEICPTCNKNSKNCIGHFGSIQLNINVLHPLFSRLIISLLKCICYKCSRVLLTEERLNLLNLLKLQRAQRFNAIVKAMDKIDICSHCETYQPKYIFATMDKQIYMIFKIDGDNTRIQMFENEIYKIFSNMRMEDIGMIGLNANTFHPKSLIISVLPVLPPVSRPYVMADTVTCDDDLTLQYVEIIKANNHISKTTTSDFKKQKYIQIIKFRIRSLFDNSGEKQKVSNGRPLKGIKKRLTGKEGIIRNNLMGKRVDKSARSVIGPDPTLKVDEIAIPQEIAKTLSYPVRVNDLNLKHIMKMVDEGKINYVIREGVRINVKYATTKLGSKIRYGDVILKKNGEIHFVTKEWNLFELSQEDKIYRDGDRVQDIQWNEKKNFDIKVGDIAERQLVNGDVLLLNRQPTLHRGSMIAMQVKIYPGKTIRLNLAVCSSYNADFDGDEMNLFSANNVETEAELRYLSSVDNFILNPQSSRANIVFVQDTVLGIYKLTHSALPPFSRKLFFQLANSISDTVYQKLESKKKYFTEWTGKFLFSLLLPDDFFYKIKNDVDPNDPHLCIEHGILKQGALQKKNLNKLVELFYIEYDIETCKNFINQVQFLAVAFLEHHSFSVGIQDCFLEKENIQYSIEKSLMKAKSVHETIQNEKIKEIYVTHSLGGARDIGLSIAKNSLRPDNNFLSTVISGAKGDFFNIAQITGLLGQQQVCTGRIQNTLTNCSRVLPHYPIDPSLYTDNMSYEAKGFIRGSFGKGLSPREFFLHSLTGREGITDTAMKSVTGDTLIYVRQGNQYSMVQIGPWIDAIMERQTCTHPPSSFKKENMDVCDITDLDYEILSVDEYGFVSWTTMTDLTRHDPTAIMYRVTTKSGRSVTCTDCKSMLVYDAIKNRLCEVSPEQLHVGDFLPVSQSIQNMYSENNVSEFLETVFGTKTATHFTCHGTEQEMYLLYQQWITYGYDGVGTFEPPKDGKSDWSFEISLNMQENRKEFRLNDVFLDPIASITKLCGDTTIGKVYDLTVPKTLNFSLANGLHIRDTATSGYIQRRMIKVAEDVQIAEDLTVRNVNNNILQFSYGNNFLNPSHCQMQNNNLVPISISRLAQRLNYQHEASELEKRRRKRALSG